VKKKYAQFGRIEVSVWRKKGAKSPPGKQNEKKNVISCDEPVPEDGLKGRAIDSTTGWVTCQPFQLSHC